MTTTNDTTGTDTRRDERRTLAVPRMHQTGCTFFLSRTGTIVLDERDGRRPVVRLTPSETFAVLSFMRLPGVAELIEQQEAARQAHFWRDFEEDPQFAGEWQAE